MQINDVFVSYVQAERPRVIVLVEALRALDLRVWFDAELKPGTSFHDEINAELACVKSQIVCWTKAATVSRWVVSEADFGAQRKVLVPIFLEPCQLRPPFNGDHVEDLSKWQGQVDHLGWRKVLLRIGDLCGRGAALHSFSVLDQSNLTELRNFIKEFPNDALAGKARSCAAELAMRLAAEQVFQEFGVAKTGISAIASQPLASELRAKEALIRANQLSEDLKHSRLANAALQESFNASKSEHGEMLVRTYKMSFQIKQLETANQELAQQLQVAQIEETTLKKHLTESQARNAVDKHESEVRHNESVIGLSELMEQLKHLQKTEQDLKKKLAFSMHEQEQLQQLLSDSEASLEISSANFEQEQYLCGQLIQQLEKRCSELESNPVAEVSGAQRSTAVRILSAFFMLIFCWVCLAVAKFGPNKFEVEVFVVSSTLGWLFLGVSFFSVFINKGPVSRILWHLFQIVCACMFSALGFFVHNQLDRFTTPWGVPLPFFALLWIASFFAGIGLTRLAHKRNIIR